MSIYNWNELEDYAAELIKEDKPIKPKGSGSSKKEEDVVGESLIVQCKYSENNNISILSKDLKRLMDAAELIEKFPLFLNKSGNNPTILSIPITDETEKIIKQLIQVSIINIKLINLNKLKKLIKFKTKIEIDNFDKKLEKLKNSISYINNDLTDNICKLENFIKHQYNDILICNLFDNEEI